MWPRNGQWAAWIACSTALTLGMTEIGMYYPTKDSQLEAFEHIVSEVAPALKEEFAATQ